MTEQAPVSNSSTPENIVTITFYQKVDDSLQKVMVTVGDVERTPISYVWKLSNGGTYETPVSNVFDITTHRFFAEADLPQPKFKIRDLAHIVEGAPIISAQTNYRISDSKSRVAVIIADVEWVRNHYRYLFAFAGEGHPELKVLYKVFEEFLTPVQSKFLPGFKVELTKTMSIMRHNQENHRVMNMMGGTILKIIEVHSDIDDGKYWYTAVIADSNDDSSYQVSEADIELAPQQDSTHTS